MDRVEHQSLVIRDLLNYHARQELNVTPWYQRRSVWKDTEKAYLINTLFEQKPVPSIYIRHSIDIQEEKAIKEVVDGQQRVRSILEYADGKFPARHPKHQKPVVYSALTSAQRSSFLMTSLSIGYLINATDPDVIEIFGRLNSVSKTLNPQEKRNSNFSGEFKQFCLRQAAERLAFWRDYNIFAAQQIARMDEVQFISELAINMMEGLVDYSPTRINATYEKYDARFSEQRGLERRMEVVFGKLAGLRPDLIRDTIFSRPPLFFSLFLILDRLKAKTSNAALEGALVDIDASYMEVDASEQAAGRGHGRQKADFEFHLACKANPHRIKSRKVRDKYIAKHLV